MTTKTRQMENKRDFEGQTLTREYSGSLVDRKLNEEDRTITFPFSSEAPVNRGYLGFETLDHSEGAINFERLNRKAPLLFNHNPDTVIGVVEKSWLDSGKRRGMATVRFATNAAGNEAYEMVRTGIYANVSFGYSVDSTEEIDDKNYRVLAFTPAELSLVSIPADTTVGVSRSKGSKEVDKKEDMTQEAPIIETNARDSIPDKAATVASQTQQPLIKEKMTDTPDLSVVRSEERKKAQQEERSRIANITALGSQHGCNELATTLVESGASIDEARAAVLERIGAKPVETVSPIDIQQERNVDYSIAAGIRGALTGDWSSKEAGFVRELSQEVERSGVKRSSEKSFLVPYSVFNRATYQTSGATTGGNLVEASLDSNSFIESLRNSTLMVGMGVTTLPGLVGDVNIPRRSANSSAYWLSSQTTAITQSESTFDQISLSPSTVGALSKFSRQTLLQATPGIEELVRTDLLSTIMEAIDLAVLNGSGSSGQPTGLLQASIGSVAGGTNGAAITLENMIKLEEEVLIDNAGSNGSTMGYVTNAKVLSALKQLRSSSGAGDFLWNSDLAARGRGATPGTVNGYQIGVTNQVPSNLTKGSTSGSCSAVLFGDFSQAILATWGNGVEIAVSDSDGTDFTNGLVSTRAMASIDVGIRQASAFSAILDVTT